MGKLNKLIKTPGFFCRDMLLKRYPLTYAADINRPRQYDEFEALPQLARPEIFLSGFISPCFPVDIVYTWVDADDLEFRKDKARYECEQLFRREALHEARFKSRDELRYSLRSICEYAPWVRKVFLVTNGQVPDWLDTSHPKIVLVPHSEIVASEYLPTFNSHVIESCLHKIPDLSEHYVYFNDDVLLLRAVTPTDFFTETGLALGFISSAIIPNAPVSDLDTPSIQAIKNSREMIFGEFGCFFSRKFSHTFHPQLKSVACTNEKTFTKSFDRCRRNRFRNNGDILCTSFLHPCIAYLEGKAAFAKTRAWYFNIRDLSSRLHYDAMLFLKLQENGPVSVCVNDHLNEAKGHNFPEYEVALKQFFDAYFPSPAPWEKFHD